MKLIYSTVFLVFLFAGCSTEKNHSSNDDSSNSATELFEKNSKTVMAFLEAYQNEDIDYEKFYSKDYVMRPTWQGGGDSIGANDVMEDDKKLWAIYDYKIVSDSINLLPGVSVDTKEADGSVRYYAEWEITKSATDSTEAKSAILKLYESFDFDDEGKIVFQQYYGDFGGLRNAINGTE
jgi:hypothetical protein